MTLGEINAKITSLTNASTTEYPNSDRLIDINLWQQKIVGMIMDAEDESYFDDSRFTGYPKVTWPLTTNRDYSIGQSQTDTGGISYAVLKCKSVSVTYDGTNWVDATPLDLAETNIGDAPPSAVAANASIDANFSVANPRYSYKNNAIWLYPLATAAQVAQGASMIAEFERGAADFTSADLTAGTAIPGFDVTFHAMLAYGPAYEWCESKALPQASSIYRELGVYEDRLRKQYSSKQLDRHLQMMSDYQYMK